MRSDQEEAYGIIADAMGLDPAEVADMCAGVSFLDREANAEYHDKSGEVNVFEVAATAIRLWKNEGYIEETPDISDLVDQSFLKGVE